MMRIFSVGLIKSKEFIKVIDLVLFVFRSFRFEDYTAQIIEDPENKTKYIGGDGVGEKAERSHCEATAERVLKTVIELGEAAFYGLELNFMGMLWGVAGN
jgi:threonyl-tRNA synthetase